MRIGKHKEEASKKSKARILKAASKTFVEKGFAGTSLADIAKKLGINQSLIYHYFENKSALWESVKSEKLKDYHEKHYIFLEPGQGLLFFLKYYLSSGYKYFRYNPDTVRILSWESLEKREGASSVPLPEQSHLITTIKELQTKGEIRRTLDPLVAALMLDNAIRGPFFDDYAALDKHPDLEDKYIALVIHCLMRALQP